MNDDKFKNPRSSLYNNFLKDSGWRETMLALCKELKAAGTSISARERFFDGYQRACRSVAFHLLTRWQWQGDIRRDAEDIASESTKILLNQETRRSGIFGSKPTTDTELRGYLSRTIWRSCTQVAMRLTPRLFVLSLEELLESGRDFRTPHPRPQQEMRAELTEVLAALEATRGVYRKLPDGVNLLDCVLAAEVGGGSLVGVKKRTLQRYAKQIRTFLARHLDDPGDGL